MAKVNAEAREAMREVRALLNRYRWTGPAPRDPGIKPGSIRHRATQALYDRKEHKPNEEE